MTLSREQKKEAIARYKEQRTSMGVYAVRCLPTGEVWVGTSRNLDAARNSVWFTLRIGAHLEKGLQVAWNEHGEAAFRYEVVEILKDDPSPLLIADLLKEAKQRWMWELSASSLL